VRPRLSERAGNEAWARQRCGAPLGRSLVKELPLVLGLFVLLYLLRGWVWALSAAASLLIVILVSERFRGGVTGSAPNARRDPDASSHVLRGATMRP